MAQMEVDGDITRPTIENWPFELFLHFVRFLQATDVLTLRLLSKHFNAYASDRSTWRTLAEVIIKEQPIALDISQTLDMLTTESDPECAADVYSFMRALSSAYRIHKNWKDYPQPRLRKILVFLPGSKNRRVDIAYLLTPGSRHMVCTELDAEEKIYYLTISDVVEQKTIGTWVHGHDKAVLTFRVTDNGAAVMFIINPGVIAADNMIEYELVRFEFPTGDETMGRFLVHSFFRQPKHLQDLTLSEDVILWSETEMDGTLTVDVMNWRTGLSGRFRTGILAGTNTLNLNMQGECISLWVMRGAETVIYNYSREFVNYCLQPDVPPQDAPPTTPFPIVFKDTANIYSPSHGFEWMFNNRSRMWESLRGEPFTHRDLIVTQFWRNPTMGNAPIGPTPGAMPINQDQNGPAPPPVPQTAYIWIAMGQYMLPSPTSADMNPRTRTWLVHRPVMMCNCPPRFMQPYPFILFGHRHGVWVEVDPATHERSIKYIRVPRTPTDAARAPEYWEKHVKTLPLPSVFDLEDLTKMNLDEPTGVMQLTFQDGRLWLLYFDGYEDDENNVRPETLRYMFPEHKGPYSLNRITDG